MFSLFFFVLLHLMLSGNAQVRFNRIYNIINYSNGDTGYQSFTNLYVLNNSYYLTASVPDPNTICACPTIAYLHLDSLGNIIKWNMDTIGSENLWRYTMPKTLIKNQKNYMLLAGNVSFSSDFSYPLLLRYDDTFTLTAEYLLADSAFVAFSGAANLCRLNNNSLLACASGTTATNSRQSIYTYAIDSNGIIKQINIYATVGFSEFYPRAIYKNQKEIILFSLVYKQVPTNYSGFVSRIIARRLDTLGNFLGYSYQGSFADSLYGVQDVIATRDGGYLIATQRYTFKPSINYQYTYGVFLKLDSIGNKQWIYNYNGLPNAGDRDHAYNVIELPSGDFMVSGSYLLEIPYDTTIAPELHPSNKFWFLSRLSPNGQSKWFRTYTYIKPNNTNNYILYNYDLDTCPDKGFILSGFLTDNVNGLSSGWLVKVDSMGCLVPGCYLTEPQNPTDSTVQVLLYPNPADQFINFVAKFFKGEVHYKLIDIQGRIIAEGITANDVTNMMDVRFLSSALYILQVYDEHTRITKKVMVVH